MKRLLLTCTDLMAIQFLVPHVKYLSQNGFSVELACSAVGGRMDELRQALQGVAEVRQVHLVRSPFSPGNRRGYGELKGIIDGQHWDVIWTNEPVMGVMTRLAARGARKRGTKVVYMVHGFHFYHGAPITNWIIFYPVESIVGRFCDSVVTVNSEDYKRALKMGLPDVRLIHGVGINTARLAPRECQNNIKKELGLDKDAFLVLSVGELNKNKNQKIIIRAIAQLKDPCVHYILCGKGLLLDGLEKQARKSGIAAQVHFLGYRTDVVNICSQSDIYVMPSRREGLPIAALEAMYCGLPLVTSNVRGLVDIVKNDESGYTCPPNNFRAFSAKIAKLKAHPELRKQMGLINKKNVIPYCIKNATKEIFEIICSMVTQEL